MAKKKRIIYKTISGAVVELHKFRHPMKLWLKVLLIILAVIGVLFFCFLPGLLVGEFHASNFMATLPTLIALLLVLTFRNIRKKKIVESFMKVEDITDKVDFKTITNPREFEQYRTKETWVFGTKREDMMAFMYNWFLSAGAIDENTKLEVYSFPFSLLAQQYFVRPDKTMKDDTTINLWCVADLGLSDETRERIQAEVEIVKPFEFSRWLPSYFDVSSVDDDDDEYEYIEVDEDDDDGEYEYIEVDEEETSETAESSPDPDKDS